jgi:hypothetical protein
MFDRLARKLVNSFVEPLPENTDDARWQREREQVLKRRAARAPSAEFSEVLVDLPADPALRAVDWLVVEKIAVGLLARQTSSRAEASRAVTNRMRQPFVRAVLRRFAKEGRSEAEIAKMIALGD